MDMDKLPLQRLGNLTTDEDNVYSIGNSGAKFSDVWAYNFNGNATTANYADLAEKYTCGEKIAPGTVMVVARVSEYDAEPSFEDICEAVIGVASEKPAYLMNSDIEGEAIALTGRVPVRVKGKARKRDPIIATAGGCARVALTEEEKRFKIGTCLENKDTEEEGLVECLIK
jgi:predicted HAD superfamily phosphohydrolase